MNKPTSKLAQAGQAARAAQAVKAAEAAKYKQTAQFIEATKGGKVTEKPAVKPSVKPVAKPVAKASKTVNMPNSGASPPSLKPGLPGE